ncbi:MAG TPA: peptidase dimerization domain-containing protein [Sedimentisphaerales bacterium]|nr:peptidase dimerization domain-containing protein [Sedimentisphaerales bacterium]
MSDEFVDNVADALELAGEYDLDVQLAACSSWETDVDVVINNHAGSGFETGYGVTGSAMYSVIYTFEGRTAHSGASPWSGRSALDAVEIMNVATNYLREHLHFTHRMHHVILEGGEAPNVVPDRARVWYFLRNTDDQLKEMYDRVLDCAKGAALATGTELADVRGYRTPR